MSTQPLTLSEFPRASAVEDEEKIEPPKAAAKEIDTTRIGLSPFSLATRVQAKLAEDGFIESATKSPRIEWELLVHPDPKKRKPTPEPIACDDLVPERKQRKKAEEE